MKKRVFIIVLDSFGIGNAPDAANFGDYGANTLASIFDSNKFYAETMRKMGLFNIDGVNLGIKTNNPIAAHGRLTELSKGKDTTIGHWEITGIVSNKALPTYPDGFPDEIINEFSLKTGRDILCNKPYSGTQVINDYGEEHINTGNLIVYTSADSVFQIAAHEDVIPLEQLYEYCKIARKILNGKHSVGRVIARPFVGTKDNFTRTSGRHDFSLIPPDKTMLDFISDAGLDVISVGKINDIFAGKGITAHYATKNNYDGMRTTSAISQTDFNGLCFVNLVDFDMLYGHRNDIDGYAAAISRFDKWLEEFYVTLREEDLLIITADHGCDPGFIKTTDHSRECVPLLIYGKNIDPKNIGTRQGFCDIGKTVCDFLSIKNNISGNSLKNIISDKK